MQIQRFNAKTGHDGAWLTPVGHPIDSLLLQKSLLERFSRGWTTPEEGLKNFQALARLQVLPDDAVFYLIASVLVDEIAPLRICCLIDNLETLEEDEEDDPELGPPIDFDDDWELIAERITAETMCEHDEWDMARLFLHHRPEFSDRVESGRRYFHGA